MRQQCSERCRARPLRHVFAGDRQLLHPQLQLGFVEHQDLLDMALDDRAGAGAWVFDRDALGDGRSAARRLGSGDGAGHGRVGRRLHPNQADGGVQRLGGNGDAGHQAAAADRRDDGVDLRRILEDFQPDGSLPGDDAVVVVGMDQGQAISLHQLVGEGDQVGEFVALLQHPGAEAFGAGDLGEGRAKRHGDSCRNAQPAGVVGDALGVIASGNRDDAEPALQLAERLQPEQRATVFERRSDLQVFQLQPDLGTGQGRERPRMPGGRSDHMPVDSRRRQADILKCHRHWPRPSLAARFHYARTGCRAASC